MQLPEDKPSLLHMVPAYDPAKAHAYYLRTRKLHPRQRGTGVPVSGRTGPTRPTGVIPPVAAQQLARQRAQATAAVKSLEMKLSELKGVLARKKAALNRDRKTQRAKPTAADKSQAARDSKQYRQKHKQELKTKRTAAKSSGGASPTKSVVANPRSGSIKQVEAAIQTVQKALTAAKARQQALG